MRGRRAWLGVFGILVGCAVHQDGLTVGVVGDDAGMTGGAAGAEQTATAGGSGSTAGDTGSTAGDTGSTAGDTGSTAGGAGTMGGGGSGTAGAAPVDAGAAPCDAWSAQPGATPEVLAVGACGQTVASSMQVYAGAVTMQVSGIFTDAPGSAVLDAFYYLDPSDPSKARATCTGCFRYNRPSEGACTCEATCKSHPVSDLLKGAYPTFSPTHQYTVRLRLADEGAGERLDFGVSDCGCFDNSGGYTVTLTPSVDMCRP